MVGKWHIKGVKMILLTQGKVAVVDDADYLKLSKFSWCSVRDHNTWYACRAETVSPNKQKRILMHREIIGGTLKIDHRDGDGLNNRRHNLRPASTSQNGQNRRKFASASSRFKGVSLHARDGRWQARIKAGAKRIQLGYFDEELDAARAYNDAAKKHFGEFANLNDV